MEFWNESTTGLEWKTNRDRKDFNREDEAEISRWVSEKLTQSWNRNKHKYAQIVRK